MTSSATIPSESAPGTLSKDTADAKAEVKGASIWVKLARAFIVAFAGGFLTAVLPIADNIASGKNVAFSVLASLAIGAIAGGFAAGVRAIIAVLPLFEDDNNFGLKRQPGTRG